MPLSCKNVSAPSFPIPKKEVNAKSCHFLVVLSLMRGAFSSAQPFSPVGPIGSTWSDYGPDKASDPESRVNAVATSGHVEEVGQQPGLVPARQRGRDFTGLKGKGAWPCSPSGAR